MFDVIWEEDVLRPVRATDGSAGYDIKAAADCYLEPYTPVIVPTGIFILKSFANNFHIDLRPRSSIFKGLVDMNIGLIDADYRHEFGAICIYRPHPTIVQGLKINKYDRIAQIVVLQHFPLILSEDIPLKSERTGGMGSTGKA